MGPLPVAGQWVRLEVPASLIGLEGQTLNGMAFTRFNGRATWDYAGKMLSQGPVPPGFTAVPVASGISNPTAMEFAPDGRLFVCQQTDSCASLAAVLCYRRPLSA